MVVLTQKCSRCGVSLPLQASNFNAGDPVCWDWKECHKRVEENLLVMGINTTEMVAPSKTSKKVD